MAVEVRLADASDRPLLLALSEAAFGAPASPAEWAWKYDLNPNRAASVIAVDDGRAVGFFGGLGTRYRGAKRDVPGAATVDVMTHPDARRLGHRNVFSDVGRAYVTLNARAGIPLDFGFPNERARRAEEHLLGVKTIEPAGQLALSLERPLRRTRLSLRRVRRCASLGSAHDRLAEALHAAPGWRTDRSAAALNWRLGARPGVEYGLFHTVDLAGRLRAFAAVRVVGDRALLVDLLAENVNGGALPDLLAGVASAMAGRARVLEVRLPRRGALHARLAGELGFAEAATDTHLVIRAFRDDVDPTAEGAAFDYRFLDHDVF
jgi:hypothetical protein